MNTPEYRLKAIRHLEEMGWAPEGNKDFWRGVSKGDKLVGAYTAAHLARDAGLDGDMWVVRWTGIRCYMDWDKFTDDQVIDLWLHIAMEGL